MLPLGINFRCEPYLGPVPVVAVPESTIPPPPPPALLPPAPPGAPEAAVSGDEWVTLRTVVELRVPRSANLTSKDLTWATRAAIERDEYLMRYLLRTRPDPLRTGKLRFKEYGRGIMAVVVAGRAEDDLGADQGGTRGGEGAHRSRNRRMS